MAGEIIHRLRDKSGETEIITINVGFGKLRIQVVGLATIAEDVTPELRVQQSSQSRSLALFRLVKQSR